MQKILNRLLLILPMLRLVMPVQMIRVAKMGESWREPLVDLKKVRRRVVGSEERKRQKRRRGVFLPIRAIRTTSIIVCYAIPWAYSS